MRYLLFVTILLTASAQLPGQESLFAGQGRFTIDSAWASYGQNKEHPEDPDLYAMVLTGGFLIKAGPTTMRGDRVLICLDKDEYIAGIRAMMNKGPGVTSGGPTRPRPEGDAGLEGTRSLLRMLMKDQETGRPREGALAGLQQWLTGPGARAVRVLYAEGKVTLEQKGTKILAADRLHVDFQIGSFTAEGTTLQVPSVTPSGDTSNIIIKAPLITERGGRVRCKDARITYCEFDDPHYHVHADTLEGWYEEGGWAFRSADNTLWIYSVPIFWVPSLSWRQGGEGPLPLKRVTGGRKSKWGAYVMTTWGRDMRGVGRWVNDLVGLPGERFDGDWELDVGWSRNRGVPLGGMINYKIEGLYEGWARGFWLDDRGDRHKGPVRTQRDGSDLEDQRWQLFTENRVHLDSHLKLDLQLWKAGDPGVMPEFFERHHKGEESAETSAHLHAASSNRYYSLLGRFDLNGFSYGEDRALADYYDEQLPSGAFLWSGEPLLDLPWNQQLILSVEAQATRFRRNYNDRLYQELTPAQRATRKRTSDTTLRTLVEGELSAPFSVGPVRIRPFATLAGVHYEDVTGYLHGTTNLADEGTRKLAASGVTATMHLSRFYPVQSDFWGFKGILHQFDPEVTWFNRFTATDDATRFHQFDWWDALDNRQRVTVALRNRLVTMRTIENRNLPVTLLRADVAATFYPNEDRDNGGDTLGLLAFDFSWQPTDLGVRETDTVSLSCRGEYNPNDRELHSFHLYGSMPVGIARFETGWVKGLDYKGTLYGGTWIKLLERWETSVTTSYDLERDLAAGYTFTLTRFDHDWTLGLVFAYDEGENDYRFSLEFVPGGWLTRQRRRSMDGIDPLDALM